jgi:hypothetical protein
VFHVDINGQRQLTNFDPLAAAGGPNRSVDRSFNISVTGSKVTIQLVPVISSPDISALEIAPAPSTSPTAIRVNAGGGALVDTLGRQWSADTGSDGGYTTSTSAAIAGADVPALYQSVRWNYSGLRYEFPVPNGSYQVNLKFAEIYYTAAGQRVFHVEINGQRQLTNFDPLAAAGGPNRPVDRSFNVSVTSSKITIQLIPVVSSPDINALEITQGQSSPPPTAIRINSGGGAFTDSQGRQWSADTGFDGGIAYTTSASITGTDTPAIYQSERWNYNGVKYELTVPNGTYTLNLKFAEIYFNTAGQRVFHVDVNGQRFLTSFDPFAAAGGINRAVDKSLTVSVTNSKLTVQLVPVVSYPKISGLEIY